MGLTNITRSVEW